MTLYRLRNSEVEAHRVQHDVERPEWARALLAFDGYWIVRSTGDGEVTSMPGFTFDRRYEPAMSGWRPIVSALHDRLVQRGDAVLLYSETWGETLGDIQVARWDGQWLFDSGMTIDGEPDFAPTHWQPLPPPPEPVGDET